MNCADAFALLNDYVKDQSLIRPILAVEAAMRAYASKFGQDEETWGIVGPLHDFDYKRWPNGPDHPLKGSESLREMGYPQEVIYASKSHAINGADRVVVGVVDGRAVGAGGVDEIHLPAQRIERQRRVLMKGVGDLGRPSEWDKNRCA